MGSSGSGKRPSSFRLNIGDTILDPIRDMVIKDRYFIIKKSKAKGCIDGYTNRTKKYYIIHCNKCNVEFHMEQYNLISRKDNCPCCSGKTVFVGYNDIATARPDLIKYFKNANEAQKYTVMSNHKVKLICQVCQSEKAMQICNLSKYGLMCTKCSDGISYPNKYIISLLNQLNVEFETEKSFKWSKNRKYDAYILYNNKRIICENMGMQHYEECNFTSRTLEEEKSNDKMKYDIAIKNRIDFYIVLDCRYSTSDYIKNSIMNSELPIIFNFTEVDIDWIECDTFATKSIIKDVCEKFKTFGLSVNDLANMYKLDNTTIRNYLHKGNKLNLCDYSSQEARRINKLNKICEFKNSNPNLSYIEIASKLNYNKYTVRDILMHGYNIGLCYYDISYEIENSKIISIKNLKRNAKKMVYVYDLNNNFKGKYNSGADAIKQNKHMDWTIKGIQKVCSGYQKSHRNHIFSYTQIHESQQDSLLLCSNE